MIDHFDDNLENGIYGNNSEESYQEFFMYSCYYKIFYRVNEGGYIALYSVYDSAWL